VEPPDYAPVIPLVLVNGAKGIGTWWSTQLRNCDPRQLVDALRNNLRSERAR
jgi:DNA topoisomerase-2